MKILIPIRLDPQNLDKMAKDPKYAQTELFKGLEHGVFKKQQKLSDDLAMLDGLSNDIHASIARVAGY